MSVLVLLTLIASANPPQVSQQQAPPLITTVATGEVQLPPEFAIVVFGVEIRDQAAAAAARRMGDALGQVVDTLVALGIPRDSLPTDEYVVTPTYDYERDRATGYHAFGSIRATIRELSTLASCVRAALARGANRISSLEFQVQDTRTARDEALRRAVTDARRDAEVLATAAGGTLGGLADLSIGRSLAARGVLALEEVVVTGVRGQSMPTVPIVPRQVTVEVTVTARWRFVPGTP